MIIDTTQSKIEHKMIVERENTNIFAALIEAADRRKIYDEDGGCSCHINPPCSYCTSRSYCEICDELNISEHMLEFEGDWICEACHIRRCEE